MKSSTPIHLKEVNKPPTEEKFPHNTHPYFIKVDPTTGKVFPK